MKRNIIDIITRPVAFSNRQLTIEGVCRTTCQNPFPHFTVEDKTGTIICKSIDALPDVGAHIEVTGNFVIDVPKGCSFPISRLDETRREYVGHHKNCSFVGCEFQVIDFPTHRTAVA